MENETIRVPIRATYHFEDGKPVMVSAEYADVPADAVAALLMRGFGVGEGGPCDSN